MRKSYRVEIQRTLLSLIRETKLFHRVSYDPDGFPVLGDTEEPTAVYVNETRAEFGRAQINRQSFSRERLVWDFEAVVAFAHEVTAEGFEQYLCETPARVLRDGADLPQQVYLLLKAAYPEHPVQQDAENGSRYRFVFEASLSPM